MKALHILTFTLIASSIAFPVRSDNDTGLWVVGPKTGHYQTIVGPRGQRMIYAYHDADEAYGRPYEHYHEHRRHSAPSSRDQLYGYESFWRAIDRIRERKQKARDAIQSKTQEHHSD